MAESVDVLKVLVGSQAHGLAGPNSDRDYRGVFIVPTSDLLSLGESPKQTRWIEGNDDDTKWEIGKFLFLATKCNPTVLECFLAPVVEAHLVGNALRGLFPHVWHARGVRDAFIGYGQNQRTKFLANKDNRAAKYAVAYLRTLYQAHTLLLTGTFTTDMTLSSVYSTLVRFKAGDFTPGEVIQVCHEWEIRVQGAYAENPCHYANMDAVNDFLLKVRKEFW